MKRNNLYLSLILVVFTLFSCTHRSYRMQTQVNRDGSCVRSISVETRDSAFIAGDTTAIRFLSNSTRPGPSNAITDNKK